MKEADTLFLLHFRHEWSDEIPDEILDDNFFQEQREHKCRKGWFYGVRTRLYNVMESEHISDVPPFVTQFMKMVGSEEFAQKERTTAEDIALGNQVMDYFLENYV
ncbi:hypothetical protein HY948_00650 [Candidatus Gottesmanbacteria bacterium]|nr:hypothetical protein [Candidatus Gottesmanbacteria bacterium]